MKREDAARMAMTAKRGRPSLPDMARHEHVLSLSMSPECHHPCARRVTNVSRPGRRGCPGNNRYGARGTLKCLNCRNRKAKCEFSSEDADCRWCAQRGLPCGSKLRGEKHQIREQRKMLGLGNTPLSKIAAQLELAYPRRTPWEISEMAREALINSGDGPDSDTGSRDGNSVTPRRDRADSIQSARSPSPPPISQETSIFLTASQRSPPRQPDSRSPNTKLEPLSTYHYDNQVSVSTPGRSHYESRDNSTYDSTNYYAERMMDHGPWSLHQSVTWQESV